MKKFEMKLAYSAAAIFLLLTLISCSKNSDFPVTTWNDNSDKPIIFYISGDAGFNSFSKSFAANLHAYGNDVFALNSKQYFWKKRTPLEAAQDCEKYLKNVIKNRKNKKIILLGFSYGADVSPFIYNRMDPEFQKSISQLIIIGPSKVNDFEIHLSEYILGEKEYGFSVLHEINNLKNVPFTLIVSDFEFYHFPINQITLKDYQFLHINGDHHYGGNTKMLAEKVHQEILP